MNKYVFGICAGVVSVIFFIYAEQLTPLSTDAFVNGCRVALPKISVERLKNRQEKWVEQLENFEKWRLGAHIGLVVGGATSLAAIWHLCSHRSEVSASGIPIIPDDMVILNSAYTQAQLQDIHDRYAWRHSWRGKFTWLSNSIFEIAATTAILALSTRLISVSWSKITEGYQNFVGPDNKDVIQDVLQKYFESAYRLIQSFKTLVSTIQPLEKNDELHVKLRLQMIRTVIVDCYAFTDATEDIASLGYCLISEVDAVAVDQHPFNIQTIDVLVGLTNEMIERTEKALEEVYLENNTVKIQMLFSVLNGITQELGRLLCDIGTRIYGKDFVQYHNIA